MRRPDFATFKRWSIKSHDPGAVSSIRAGLGVGQLTALVFSARGLNDPSECARFLSPKLSDLPDPTLIPGMDRASKILAEAVRAGTTVWIYTDFDADGVTSAALLKTFFDSVGANSRTWLPRRDREGYGLHVEPLNEMAAEGGGVVLTADCGITALEPALHAKRLGLTLVVTDHHNPLETLPEADAVVNPKLPGSSYPDPAIAGVGVAWNLVCAVRRELKSSGRLGMGNGPDVRELLDLVALGTVADVVPLRNVNRTLTQTGLKIMNQRPRPGIAALAEIAGLKGEILSHHLAFQIGPRINAAGRMEGPEEALRVLMAKTPGEAREPASVLDRLNRERREEEQRTLSETFERASAMMAGDEIFSLVVDGEGYHPGVVGIVASRIAESFYRPVVVLSVDGDTAKGSARSIPPLDLYGALSACGDLFERFGGHRAAAGLTIKTSRIGEFRRRLEEEVRARLNRDDLVPVLEADAEAEPRFLTPEAVNELSMLSPFGYGNSTPTFVVRNMTVKRRSAMGQTGEHLKLDLEAKGTRIEAVSWSGSSKYEFARPGSAVDIIGSVKTRTWNSSVTVQITIEDAIPAE